MHYDSGFSKSWYVGVEEAICIDMGTRYTRYDILNLDHQNHRSTQRELQQQKAEKGKFKKNSKQLSRKKKILKKIYKIQNIGHFSNLLSEKQLHLFIRKYSDFLSIDFS